MGVQAALGQGGRWPVLVLSITVVAVGLLGWAETPYRSQPPDPALVTATSGGSTPPAAAGPAPRIVPGSAKPRPELRPMSEEQRRMMMILLINGAGRLSPFGAVGR